MDKPTENALAIIGPHKPKTSTTDQPLPLDDQPMDAAGKTITIDLTAIGTRIDPPQTETIERDRDPEHRSAPDADGAPRRKFLPLAASLAFAVIVGGLAGVAVSAVLSDAPPAAPAAAVALTDETRALREKVVRLSSELATMKASIETSNRTSATQLNKIGERLDRAEKAQAEPSAKLAKIVETLDRLERRTASAAAPDVTGSVTSVEKQQSKPPVIEGWTLRDYYAGRAVLENRNGRLYEVGPGSNLPGVGQIETIKRVDGKVVVTTPKGIITSSLEPPRRPAYHMPRGY